MGIDFEKESLILFTLVLLVIGMIIFYKIFAHFIKKHFLYESTWIVQNIIFKSNLVFKYSAYTVLVSYLVFGVYFSAFTKYWYCGLILLGSTTYLIYQIIKDKKNGNLKIKETFDFQRHSTPVNYYNAQSKAYRRKSYNSVINRITLTNFEDVKNEEFRSFLEDNFLPQIENLITFEFYDARLCNSISDHYTGSLFYSKFYKSLLETISRINKQTNELEDIEGNYKNITDILLNIKLLKFDDNQGLYYDTSLVDLELEKSLGREEKGLIIEKSLLNINQSIKDLKYALKDIHLNTVSEYTNLLKSVEDKTEEIRKIIEYDNSYKIYILPQSCTLKDIEGFIIDFYNRTLQLSLLPKNTADIAIFVTRKFRNDSKKQRSRNIREYRDRDFFIEKRENFYKAISSLSTKYGLEKKLLAEIILQEFPDIGHGLKTIQDRL